MNEGRRSHIVRNLEDLSAGTFAPAFERFVEALPGFNRLSYSVAWLSATRPAFTRSGETPFFVMVQDGPEVIGVAPLLLESRGAGLLSYRRLRFWGSSGRYLEYPTFSVLALPGHESDVENVIVEALVGPLSGDFDEIALPRVDPDDGFIRRLSTVFEVATSEDLGDRVHLFGHHQTIDEKLRGKYLKRFRSAERKLRAETSSFEMTTRTRVDERIMDEIRALHVRRQQELIARGRPRISLFEDPVESDALRSMIRVAEDRGALRVYLQRVDGRLMNFWICFASDGYVVSEIMASTRVPGHPEASSCMLRFILREEIEKHGTEWFDLGFGTHHQKSVFSNTLIRLRSIVLVNQHRLASRLRHRALAVARVVRRLARRG